jgi:hypothetical protein
MSRVTPASPAICDCKSQQAAGPSLLYYFDMFSEALTFVNEYGWRFIEINKNGVFRVGSGIGFIVQWVMV